MPKSTFSQGFWYVLFGAMLWGTTGTAQAFAPDAVNPLSIGAVRIAIGGSALFISALLRGRFKLDNNWPIRAVILAALGMAAYQAFFFSAVSRTGIAIGTIVTIGSVPLLTGLLAALFLKEKPALCWYPATATAIIGCILLIAPSGDDRVNAAGVLFALIAGLSFSIYVLAGKYLLVKYPTDTVLAVVLPLGALLLSPVLFVYQPTWVLEWPGFMIALHLGLLATAFSYTLFTAGLSLLPASTAVTVVLAEPLTATILGIFLVGERLTALSFTGAALVLIALIIVSKTGRTR